MAIPIWKDKFVTLGSGAYHDFTVYAGPTNLASVIYQGRAYKKPGDANVMVRVNDICADFLKQYLDDLTDVATAASRNFSVYVGATLKEAFKFYMNYEYKDGNTDKVDLSPHAPITGRIQEGMFVPLSMLDTYPSTSDYSINFLDASGVYHGTIGDVGLVGPFNLYQPVLTGYKSVGFFLVDKPNVFVSYDIIPKCHRYALYYVNALGGIDVLVIEGKHRVTDNYERKTYKQTYNNGSLAARGEVDYNNDISRSWELYTGWLTDAEAGRMGHLLGSPLVCLCDCDDNNQLHPVIITNKDCPYKTHKDGMVSYQIDVTLARDMRRQ